MNVKNVKRNNHMKKLYLISNYTTALYELDENGDCKIKDQPSITIDQAIEIFKSTPSVKCFGLKKAIIQELLEDGNWKVIKQLIPNESAIENAMKRISLKSSIFIGLQMDDYDNWKDGEYFGDNEKLVKQTEWILKDVFKWIDNGMPGGRDIDLTRYKKLTSSGLCDISKK